MNLQRSKIISLERKKNEELTKTKISVTKYKQKVNNLIDFDLSILLIIMEDSRSHMVTRVADLIFSVTLVTGQIQDLVLQIYNSNKICFEISVTNCAIFNSQINH